MFLTMNDTPFLPLTQGPASSFCYHVAAIIPLLSSHACNKSLDDLLLPISQNTNLIQAAVFHAALAGAHTIWLVGDPKLLALTSAALPRFIALSYKKHDCIPIYRIIPGIEYHMQTFDENKLLLYGAYIAHKTTSQASLWLAPVRYFALFPRYIYNYDISMEQIRQPLRIKNVVVQSQNEILNYAFDLHTWKDSYEHYKLDQKDLITSRISEPHIINIPEYYYIKDFNDYRKFWASNYEI